MKPVSFLLDCVRYPKLLSPTSILIPPPRPSQYAHAAKLKLQSSDGLAVSILFKVPSYSSEKAYKQNPVEEEPTLEAYTLLVRIKAQVTATVETSHGGTLIHRLPKAVGAHLCRMSRRLITCYRPASTAVIYLFLAKAGYFQKLQTIPGA